MSWYSDGEPFNEYEGCKNATLISTQAKKPVKIVKQVINGIIKIGMKK